MQLANWSGCMRGGLGRAEKSAEDGCGRICNSLGIYRLGESMFRRNAKGLLSQAAKNLREYETAQAAG